MTILKKILNRLDHILKHGGLSYLFYLLKMFVFHQVLLLFNNLISPLKIKKISIGFLITLFISLILTSLIFQQQWLYYFLAAILLLSLCYLSLRFVRRVYKYQKIIKNTREFHADFFTKWGSWAVSSEIRQAVNLAKIQNSEKEILLGSIDNEGRVYSVFGLLPGWQNISKDSFIDRYHFPMEIVLIDDYVLIKKNFKRNLRRFINEWFNLVILSKVSNVPAVYKADILSTILYKNMIVGRTIRDILVEAGAQILNIQTDHDPELEILSGSERSARILKRGTDKLPSCLSSDFLMSMEQQLNVIHAQGIANLSLTFGNIMVDKFNQPWFIDFEGSRYYSSTENPVFIWERDQDRKKFNIIYDQSILTFDKVVAQIKDLEEDDAGKYAPIDFGYGLTLGQYWIVDSGTGRWDYFNRKVLSPIILGKRSLDLGSHNGILPLMMAKHGAKEVLGLEMDPQMVYNASIIKSIMEWRDIKTYNLTILEKDMRAILNENFGLFDIITAFCSLYYLSEDEMANVVRKASHLAPMIIVQAKMDTRLSALMNKAKKSSISFLESILKDNGFPEVKIIAPKRYSRPILIGTKDQ